MSLQLYMLVLSVLTSVSLSSQKSELRHDLDSPQCKEWVDSVYATLTPKERIAQLLVANVSPEQGEKSKANIKTLVEKYHVGGLLFSKGTVDQFAEMTNYAQSLAQVPLLMTLDGEWGAAMRVSGAPVFPYNIGLGAIRDKSLLYHYGQEMARECKALGIQVNFAPVMDVNSNPDNPVIGRRSFGEDPRRVSDAGCAYSLGLESGGVMAVAKHFPGHGDTGTDSHKALPQIDHTLSTLQEVDLLPFKNFISAGCSGIMVGHLSVPVLDSSGTPASMSNKITSGLLKDKMGFDGLIFTDGLGMKGAAVNDNLCVAALKAGADVLLNPVNVPNDISAIETAVKAGKIKQSVIEERCKKMLAYKYVLGLDTLKPVDRPTLASTLNTPHATSLIQQLSDASVTAVHNKGSVLPISGLDKKSIAVVNIGAGADNEFADLCRRYADVDVYASKDGALTHSQITAIKNHDVVIAAVYTDNQAARTSLTSISKAKEFVPVFLINPYKMTKYSKAIAEAGAFLALYDDSPYLRKSAAKALFGGIDVTGRMPVKVEGVAGLGEGVDIEKTRLGFSSLSSKGMSEDLTNKVDSVVLLAMNNGAFPGAQVLVVKDGDIVLDRCYGYTTKGGDKVTPSTVYDLASVSKTVGTLPGVMKAYDEGLFELDRPASQYVPGLNVEGKADITPRMLLYHETGIPASLNVYEMIMDTATYKGKVVSAKRDRDHTIAINGGGYGSPTAQLRSDIVSRTKSDKYSIEAAKGMYVGECTYDTIMSDIYNIAVRPSRDYVYSCLNFCLLMDMEQRLTGTPHQQWVDEKVWEPIGATSFCYRPLERYPLTQIAATEEDTYLRKQHVHGYVHDETAAFSGGVQGNAGVFGNATDIAKLCQLWLNGGIYGDARVYSDSTNHLFTTDKSPTCRRGLGFDKPDMNSKKNSPTCDEAGPNVYGHTGFTGTCFWVDPDKDLVFVFLSNRVDPSRKNPAFTASSIRPVLMSLVYQAIDHR